MGVGMKKILLFTMSLLIFSHCHSKDLGGEAPDRVQLDTSLTDWDHGAGAIIQQKCANCHTAQRPQTVPGNTPHSLDDINRADFFTESKNKAYIMAMRKRVESDSGDRIMPPKFATPLYPDERQVLLAFLDLTLKNLDVVVKPSPPPEDPLPPPTTPSKWVWADMKPIAMSSCAKGGCHDGSDMFALMSREDFVSRLPGLLDEVLSGYMPMDDDAFKESAEGKKMIQWLSEEAQSGATTEVK